MGRYPMRFKMKYGTGGENALSNIPSYAAKSMLNLQLVLGRLILCREFWNGVWTAQG